MPCPKCGEYKSYAWERLVVDNRREPLMRCAICGNEFSESEWKAGSGKWIAQSAAGGSGNEDDAAEGGGNSENVEAENVSSTESEEDAVHSAGLHEQQAHPPAPSKARGFHMNAFASPWTNWKSIVDSYHEAYAGGENMLKV